MLQLPVPALCSTLRPFRRQAHKAYGSAGSLDSEQLAGHAYRSEPERIELHQHFGSACYLNIEYFLSSFKNNPMIFPQ
jgi:HPt (histidine-containing phosphotransfer) domain-containing protein